MVDPVWYNSKALVVQHPSFESAGDLKFFITSQSRWSSPEASCALLQVYLNCQQRQKPLRPLVVFHIEEQVHNAARPPQRTFAALPTY